MKIRTAAFLILVALGAASLGWWFRGFVASDACLDHGGRWEARGGFCEGARRS